ncbi:Fc.00g022940.m01.CDS01 [Cosmosporella sp. VM-42]
MRTLNSNINTFDTPTPAGLNHPPPPRRSKTPTLKHHPSPPPRSSTPAVAKFPPAAANPDSRCSLGFRDHNQHVLAVTTTTTKRSVSSSSASSAKMPPADNRPRPPQLSAAAAKTVGRTPLTPKIATKPGQMVTPLVRRTTGNSIGTVNRDDTATPPFLANSITPRSGSRQSRVESTNTTPNGTPNPERSSEGWDPRSSFSFDNRQLSSHTDSSSDNHPDSKFFRASDARSSLQQPPHHQRPSSVPQKPATFFYANGTTAEAKRNTTPPIASPYTPQPEPASSKFFYANGTPNVSSKPTLQPSGPPSAGSNNPRTMTGRPSTGNSSPGHGFTMPSRPMSPIKMLQQNLPVVKNNATTSGPNNTRPQLSSPPQLTPTALPPSSKRRVSIESAPRALRGHARTGSVPAMDSWTSPKFPVSPTQQPSEPSSPLASPSMLQPAMSMATILQAAEDLAEESESKDDELPSGLQSPTKSTHSSDPINELVANARRERKVQDLEITNASLEAINRTLERQLRKQTAEIRRYKRLSRSGALASMPSSRVTSGALAAPPFSLTDLSEDEDSASEEEEEPDSFDDSELSGTDSTSAGLASPTDDKGIARRNRDERRLQLDLTKHRELLVDSQKINQSLKRCLNWTEVLIKEGQKALEYKVRVSDVEFGGHVLAPPDEEDDEDLSQIGEVTLGSYEAGLEPPWEKSSQDRDSGIELPADGG